MTSPSHQQTSFSIGSMPRFPTPSGSRARGSIGTSFSLGPQQLVDSYLDANSSTISQNQSMALDPNRSMLPASPLRSSPRRRRQRERHPLATDTTDIFQESDVDADDDEEYAEWGMVDRMRLWRHDAMMQHLYDTAIFWGDKVLSWTNDPNDAFWLAQTHFMQGQFSRAERLLTRPFPIGPQKLTRPLVMMNGSMSQPLSGKGKGKERDPPPPNPMAMPRLPMGPAGIISVPEDIQVEVSRLVDMSVACRYLAAQCQMRQGNLDAATELLGEANPFRDSGKSGPSIANVDGGIKVEASMCHLRGLLMQKLNRADVAKTCFMEALALDVKCYDAFSQLVNSEMLPPDEEWEFVQALAYRSQTPEDADFVRLMYISRLRKYDHGVEHAVTRQRLVEEYGLDDNPDVLYSFADALYVNFRWKDCFTITSRILGLVSVHDQTLPLHIACMYHLPHLHSKLFILAHDMVDREPDNALSWYAVGVWYLAAKNYSTARQYFSKTSLMDPRLGPAWIAFGHTFALEEEHDHAITAYSTCARLFPGSHMALMFIGMEQITLSNFAAADEALAAAHSMCKGDPLLINERGVMAFNHNKYQEATDLFNEAIQIIEATQSSKKAWATTYLNLGTCYRKLGRLPEAKDSYQKVLTLDPRNALALGYAGMVCHLMGELDQAIVTYHEALSLDPANSHVMEMLDLALELNAAVAVKDELPRLASILLTRFPAHANPPGHDAGQGSKASGSGGVDAPQDVSAEMEDVSMNMG